MQVHELSVVHERVTTYWPHIPQVSLQAVDHSLQTGKQVVGIIVVVEVVVGALRGEESIFFWQGGLDEFFCSKNHSTRDQI